MKTAIIVALLLTSIFLLGTMELAAQQVVCKGEAKYYNLNWRSSNGEQGTECAALCFYEGSASLTTCSYGESGEFVAEDLTTDMQNYVGEALGGQACHIRLRKHTSRDVLYANCAMVSSNPGISLWYARGVLVDGCGCLIE